MLQLFSHNVLGGGDGIEDCIISIEVDGESGEIEEREGTMIDPCGTPVVTQRD